MERYEKICQIGNGAFSKVYKCRVRDSGNLVAIKMLLEEDEEDPRLKQLAMREIRLLNVSPYRLFVLPCLCCAYSDCLE